jgi:ABC-type uncharacterized transport system involved in gliding motility auxiliary subunit
VRRASSLLGLIGVILLLFAGVAAVLTRARSNVDIVYIGVHLALGLFAIIAYLSAGLEQVRDVVSERSTRYGANVVLGSVLFIAVLAALNYLAYRHSHRWDLTEQGVYSLSSQSKNVVRNLQQDLTVQAFVEGGVNPELRDLLEVYAHESPKFKFEIIDPDRQPELAERYQIRQYNTVRFEYGKESTTITQPTEENITNAIIRVTRTTQKTICFIEGHGEPDTDDVQNPNGLASFKQALNNENYEVKKVLLASMASVPDDCTAVVVAGPQKPYLDSELAALDAYLNNGGRALFLLPPRGGQEFQPLLAKLGVKLGNDVVVDQVIRLFQGPALGLTPLVNTYGAHEITREFKQRTVFPMTRSVRADSAGKAGLTATELAKTSRAGRRPTSRASFSAARPASTPAWIPRVRCRWRSLSTSTSSSSAARRKGRRAWPSTAASSLREIGSSTGPTTIAISSSTPSAGWWGSRIWYPSGRVASAPRGRSSRPIRGR